MEEYREIWVGDVAYRKPYYLRCSRCGLTITDDVPDNVMRRANRNGWHYLIDEGQIICPICWEDMKEEEQ